MSDKRDGIFIFSNKKKTAIANESAREKYTISLANKSNARDGNKLLSKLTNQMHLRTLQ